MNKQLQRMVPVVVLAGLGLVTTGCSLLTPTTAPIVDSGATTGTNTGSDSGWFDSGSDGGWFGSGSGSDGGWFDGGSGGLFGGGGFGSGLFGGFFG